jgi:hypothetical protein
MPGTMTCPRCGYTWHSRARSQKTECGQCHSTIYVPTKIRNGNGNGTVGRPAQVSRPRPTASPPRQAVLTPPAYVEDDFEPEPEQAPVPDRFEVEPAQVGRSPATTSIGSRIRERAHAVVPRPAPNVARDGFRRIVAGDSFAALAKLGCGHEVVLPSQRPAQWTGLVSCPACREPAPYRMLRSVSIAELAPGALVGDYAGS